MTEQPEEFFAPPSRRDVRRDAADRDRRQRKGQRAFYVKQRADEMRRDTIAAQKHVLETREPGDPMYDNVFNDLVTKHGAPE